SLSVCCAFSPPAMMTKPIAPTNRICRSVFRTAWLRSRVNIGEFLSGPARACGGGTGLFFASVDQVRKENPAIVPERGHFTFHLVGGSLSEIAFEDLGVVADLLDDVIRPVVGEAQGSSHARSHAEKL